MKNQQIGIISCSSIVEQVRNSIDLNDNYRIYPLVPSCMFTISSELIRHVFDQACLDNDIVLLIYGNCHPDLQNILRRYSRKIIKLKGANCWEMLLGKKTAQDYEAKGYWLLKNALCTTWRKEVFISYGAGSPQWNLINNCNTKKVLGCRFEAGKPQERDVASFAQVFGIPYEIKDFDLTSFNALVFNGIKKAKSSIVKQRSLESKPVLCQNKSHLITTEAQFSLDTLSNQLVFISPEISQLLGYSTHEFNELYISDPEGKFYKDKNTYNQISAQRYDYFSQCLSCGIQLPFYLEYQIFRKNGSVIWIRESFSPKYNNDGTIDHQFIGKLENITNWKTAEEKLQKSYEK